MPVDRGLAADLATDLVDLYADAQTRLATHVAQQLAGGMAAPDWAQAKLAALGKLQAWTGTLLGRLAADSTGLVEQQVVLAYARGSGSALDELRRLGRGDLPDLAEIRQAIPGIASVQRLQFTLTSQLRGTHLRIARWALDSYRTVIGETAAPAVLLGLDTRRRAAQRAWEKMLDRGVTGFEDRAGRRWELQSYVEMATRTTVAQAAVEGHLDRLADADLDLVVVSDAPQECERCRPWEGKVLVRGGPGGARTIEREHATKDDEQVKVKVAGSVDEAIGAGLMHPNCRHSLRAYLPGVTKIPKDTADPEGDQARQQLRALERLVRKWKLREAAAIDPAAKATARAKVREHQARIRAHVDATPGLLRQRAREQVGQAR